MRDEKNFGTRTSLLLLHAMKRRPLLLIGNASLCVNNRNIEMLAECAFVYPNLGIGILRARERDQVVYRRQYRA